jgi:large subunit ribosomal protein L23
MRSAYDVIIKPVISEKSMDQAQNKKYTFKVAVDANKTEVKHAIEEIFDVEVKKVNIMNVNGKLKENGKKRGNDTCIQESNSHSY